MEVRFETYLTFRGQNNFHDLTFVFIYHRTNVM